MCGHLEVISIIYAGVILKNAWKVIKYMLFRCYLIFFVSVSTDIFRQGYIQSYSVQMFKLRIVYVAAICNQVICIIYAKTVKIDYISYFKYYEDETWQVYQVHAYKNFEGHVKVIRGHLRSNYFPLLFHHESQHVWTTFNNESFEGHVKVIGGHSRSNKVNHENWHKSYYVDLFYLLTIEKQVIAKAGETSGSRTALFKLCLTEAEHFQRPSVSF